jgi:hypothetical protein
MVSAVSSWGASVPQDFWTQQKWNDYQEIKRKAEEFDKATKQPDCVDPAKEAWEKKVLELLQKISDKLDNV